MILADGISVKGKPHNVVVHFDRNGFGYTLDRTTGELLVAAKYDPKVNWATHVDMKTGRPQVVSKYSTQAQGADVNTKGICPAALGSKDQQPAAYNPANKMFYVPTNHRSEEHTSELQSQSNLVCRLLLEKKKKKQ